MDISYEELVKLEALAADCSDDSEKSSSSSSDDEEEVSENVKSGGTNGEFKS